MEHGLEHPEPGSGWRKQQVLGRGNQVPQAVAVQTRRFYRGSSRTGPAP
jgi:hypothetical protein